MLFRSKGDFVTIEYSSPLVENNKKFQDSFKLGDGKLAPGFEEKIISMKEGEEKEFSLKIPDGYFKKELAGKEADFQVKVIKVQKMILPELTDHFAKSVGQFKDLAGLKQNIKQGIEAEKKNVAKEKWLADVLQKIFEKAEFEIPQLLVKSEKVRILEKLKNDVADQLKVSYQQYLEQSKKTEKEMEDKIESQAHSQVSSYLILRQIGKERNIKVSQDEAEKEAQTFLKSYPQEQKDKIDINQLKEYHRNRLFNQKVWQELSNQNK